MSSRGGWTSRQHSWQTAADWWPAGIPELPEPAARSMLARRWLAVFGPATVGDLQWWTGLTLGEVRRALAGVETVEVDLDGAPGLVLADDIGPVRAPKPSAATVRRLFTE